jgi:hypothetical protein
VAAREGHMLQALSFIHTRRLTPAPAVLLQVSSSPPAHCAVEDQQQFSKHRMISGNCIGEEVEGRGRGLIQTIPQHVYGGTEKKHKILQSGEPDPELRFELTTLRIRGRIATLWVPIVGAFIMRV